MPRPDAAIPVARNAIDPANSTRPNFPDSAKTARENRFEQSQAPILPHTLDRPLLDFIPFSVRFADSPRLPQTPLTARNKTPFPAVYIDAARPRAVRVTPNLLWSTALITFRQALQNKRAPFLGACDGIEKQE